MPQTETARLSGEPLGFNATAQGKRPALSKYQLSHKQALLDTHRLGKDEW